MRLPAAHAATAPPPENPGADPVSLDSGLIERSSGSGASLSRWMGWRLRLLVISALLGCVAMLMLSHWLSGARHIDASWQADEHGQVILAATTQPQLQPFEGQALRGFVAADGSLIAVDALTLRRASRWITSDAERERHAAMHQAISLALREPEVRLRFANGESATIESTPRGVGSLGPMYWLTMAMALALYLVAMVVLLARPGAVNLLYALGALSQVGNLVFLAIESTMALALPEPVALWNMPARASFDLVTAATIAHTATIHPRCLPGSGLLGAAIWAGAATLIALLASHQIVAPWWWVQGSVGVLGLLTLALLTWSRHLEPHPFALVLRRLGVLAMLGWAVLTAGVIWAEDAAAHHERIANLGPSIWPVFLASLLILVPFLSRSQQVMREFSLLAAISTIATALDLLFAATFSLGQFASLTLALFLSLGLYSGVRQWLLNQLRNQNVLTTERMFEKLYRIAREVEAHPERAPALLTQLLQDLYDPLEAFVVEQPSAHARVAGGGSSLILPVPSLSHTDTLESLSIVLRYSHRGRRLFTSEDARLAERVVEQLQRAVAFDQAVEQGRNEERLRLAQDLHDDIGARLLTLMYKAQSPEMEDYLRHTLQDLKTLTRGLAAPSHTLSHAAAEWKADLTQRLAAAHMMLGWSVSFDRDISLTVVQWSALTRVLRELVSNAIAHSQARRIDITFELEGDAFTLTVIDNGAGRNPQDWAHGLGLGGVRKRVKQLGGEVNWTEVPSGGICCRVHVQPFTE